jgi:O-antigen/teichoic acid export membrane protein
VYGAATQLHLRVDLFALSALGRGASEVGAYGAAQNLAVTPGLFAMAFAPLVLASMSRLRGEGRLEEARRLGQGALRLAFCLLAFAGLVAGAAGPIVLAIFGEPFHAAGPLLALLFPASLFLVVATVSISVVTAGEAGAPLGSIGIALVAATIAAHVYVVPRHGAVGAALVTLASGFALAAVGVTLVLVRWRVSALPSLARSVAVALMTYSLARDITPGSPWMLMLELVAGSTFIVVAMVLLGEFSLEERDAIRAWMCPRRVASSSVATTDGRGSPK